MATSEDMLQLQQQQQQQGGIASTLPVGAAAGRAGKGSGKDKGGQAGSAAANGSVHDDLEEDEEEMDKILGCAAWNARREVDEVGGTMQCMCVFTDFSCRPTQSQHRGCVLSLCGSYDGKKA